MRKLLKITGYALLGLLGLIVLIAIFAILPLGESIIKGILEDQLASASGYPVSIEDFDWNLFSHLSIDGLVIGDPESRQPSIRLSHLSVGYNLHRFLFKDIDLADILIDSIDVSVLRDSSGNLLLPVRATGDDDTGGTRADTSSSGYTIAFDSLAVNHIGFYYTDYALDLEANVVHSEINVGRDSTDTYRYSFRIDSTESQYSGTALPAVSVTTRGQANPKSVRVDTLTVSTDSLELAASAAMSLDEDTTVTGKIVLRGDPSQMLDRARQIYGLPDLKTKGNLNASVDIAGRPSSPRVRSDIDAPAVDVANVSAGESHIVITYSNDSLRIDSVSVVAFDGTVNGSALLVMDSIMSGQVNISLAGLKVATLWAVMYDDQSPYQGLLGGTVTVDVDSLNLDGLRANADLDITDIRYRDQRLPDLQANLSYRAGRGELSVNQQEFALSAEADITGDALTGAFDISVPQLDLISGWFGIDSLFGSLFVDGSLAGTIEAPQVSASISGDSVVYRNFPVDSIAASVAFRDSILVIESANVSGSLDSIHPFYPVFGLDSLRGGFSYDVSVSGSPDSLTGTADIAVDSIYYGQYGVDSGSVAIEFAGRTLSLTNAAFYQDSALLRGRGDFNIETMKGRLSVDVLATSGFDGQGAQGDNTNGSDTPIERHGTIESTFDLSDSTRTRVSAHGDSLYISVLSVLSRQNSDLSGRLSFDVDFAGTVRNPDAVISATLINPTYEDVALDSVMLTARLSDTVFVLDTLSAFGLGHEMAANASIGLVRDSLGNLTVDSTSSLEGRMYTRDIQLALLEVFLPEGMELDGFVTIDAGWNGTIGEPHVTGDITVDSALIVPGPDIDTIDNVMVQLAFEDSMVTITEFTGIYRESPFTLDGSVIVADWRTYRIDLALRTESYGTIRGEGMIGSENIDFTANLDTLRLALFAEFVPMVDSLTGRVTAQARVTGSPDQPDITATMQAHEVVVKPTMLDSTISGGVIVVSYENDNLQLDSLYARLGGGYMTASGTASIDGTDLTDVDLRAGIKSVAVLGPDIINVRIDTASFTYRNDNGTYVLGGLLNFGETRFLKDFDIDNVLPWAKSVEAVETEAPQWQRDTRLDIRVTESDSIWVDNNLANIRLQVDVEVLGTVANPNLTGRIAIAEGYLSYVDRNFDVETGNVFFVNPNRFNPEVDLTAVTSVTNYQGSRRQTYEITFSAQGPLDQLRTSLTSDPPLSQPDIVSLLTVGATREQLVGSEAETGAVLTERAERFGSRRITGFASRKVADVFGLEQFTIEGNIFDIGEEGEGPRISATKRLSEKIRLTYSTVVGALNEQTVQVEYLFTDHWSVEGQTNREGDALINLLYRIRFK